MTGALGYFGGGISSSLWIDNDINGTLSSLPRADAIDCSSLGPDPTEVSSAAECPDGCIFVYGMRGETNTCTKDDVEDGLGAQEEQGGGYYLNGMIPLSCQADLPHLHALRWVRFRAAPGGFASTAHYTRRSVSHSSAASGTRLLPRF